jgi:CheY-like chemotaxis protein
VTAGIPRILIVDDEAAIRKFVRIGLTAQQCEVIEAENGAEGLRMLTARDPDLVILDLGLPDVDGQEVIDAIRAVSAAPIIVLSVRAEEHDKIAALDHGPATTSPSPSAWASSRRASARCCATATPHTRRRRASRPGRCTSICSVTK